MATVAVRDDAIWIRHIEGDKLLQERLSKLRAGDSLHLEVDGIVGVWERMQDAHDGRPTLGIRPVAEMRAIWARMRADVGRVVQIREVMIATSYLEAVAATLTEWNSAEDEAAYADL